MWNHDFDWNSLHPIKITFKFSFSTFMCCLLWASEQRHVQWIIARLWRSSGRYDGGRLWKWKVFGRRRAVITWLGCFWKWNWEVKLSWVLKISEKFQVCSDNICLGIQVGKITNPNYFEFEKSLRFTMSGS